MHEPIRMVDLDAQHAPMRTALERAFARVLESGAFVLGPEVIAFEGALAEHLGVKHAVSCASGSDALVLALRALDVGPGDDVLTTSFSFIATAEAIVRVGARPIFVDVSLETFGLDAEDAARKRTPRTKAILPVHLFGQMTPMAPLEALAAQHGLSIVEDAAQAIGAREGERLAATIGAAGALSFFPTKNLGALGDGGMVLTNSDTVAERVRSLARHGESQTRYVHDHIGMNSRLDSIQAALLREKLPHLRAWSAARAALALEYARHLEGLPSVILPRTRPGATHVFNQYTIRTPARDHLAASLTAASIGSAIYYPVPLHLQPCFRALGGRPGDCPNAERLASEVLSIPVHAALEPKAIARVASFVRQHAENHVSFE